MNAHEWMLDLVKAAEELGYLIRYVGPSEIQLTGPNESPGGYLDITIRGTFLDGKALRLILQSVAKPEPVA